MGDERGQTTVLLLGVVAAAVAGALILAALGQAYGARSHAQRGADLAAIAAAQTMRREYQRLFEPAYLRPGVPNPRHLSKDAYLAAARAAAVQGARANGVPVAAADVSFPGGSSFAPTRVSGRVRAPGGGGAGGRGGRGGAAAAGGPPAEIEASGGAMAGFASGGGYSGPLAYRQGKPLRTL